MTTSDVTIAALTAGSVEDYLAFFDRDAFPDNPEWAACYCYFHLFPGSGDEWERTTASENRPAMTACIARGDQQGLLAYREGHVIGWCQANRTSELPGFYRRWDGLDAPAAAEETGVVTCFVVAPSERGQGLARRLLDAACERFREQGLRRIEAYPRKDADNAARSYHGSLQMYLDAGFEPVRETERLIVGQRALARGSR